MATREQSQEKPIARTKQHATRSTTTLDLFTQPLDQIAALQRATDAPLQAVSSADVLVLQQTIGNRAAERELIRTAQRLPRASNGDRVQPQLSHSSPRPVTAVLQRYTEEDAKRRANEIWQKKGSPPNQTKEEQEKDFFEAQRQLEIEERAFGIWEKKGKPAQSEEQKKQDYFEAESQIETLKRLKATAGFKGLTQQEQEKLLRYVGGTNVEISGPANKMLKSYLDTTDGSFDASDPEHIRWFLTEQPAALGVVSPLPGAFEKRRAPYKTHGPTEVKNYSFRSKKVDAQKYEIEIGKNKIPVYVPKTPSKSAGESHAIDEIAKGLAVLPEAERSVVTKVNVEPAQNPDDAYWAVQYNDPNFRSYMTSGAAGVISVYPSGTKMTQDYLEGTMIHETGHTLSKQKWGEDTTKAKWKPWRDAMASDGIVASKYAKASVDEDFSEVLQLYEQVKGSPQEAEIRAMMPKRFKIIDDLLSGK